MLKRLAISYFRFSHRRQEKGSTIERQQALLDAYLRSHPDVEVIHTFKDAGKSAFHGTHAKRGDLARLIDMLERGVLTPPIILIIESIDRLSREPVMDALDRFSALLKLGVEIHVCDRGWELTRKNLSGAGVGDLFSLIGAMTEAHNSSSRKSTLVKGGWTKQVQQARQTGKAVKGYTGPPWVSVNPKTGKYDVVTEADRYAAATVEMIFDWRIEQISDHAIAKRLNEMGRTPFRAHMPKSRRRGGWYQSCITELLRNRQVLGEHAFYDSPQVMQGYFPQIITPERFELAQNARNVRDSYRGRKGKELSNLFTGIATCAHCGGRMTMTRNQKATYLHCSNRKRRFECKATGMIRYAKAEKMILSVVSDLPWGDIIGAGRPDDPVPPLKESVAQIEAEIAVLTKQQKTAAAMVAEDESFKEEFGPIIIERRQQIAAARIRLAEKTKALSEAEADRTTRPHLKASAVDFMRQIEESSETERLVLRTRLAHALNEMTTGLECDTMVKTISVTHGSRLTTLIKVPSSGEPHIIGSMWLNQPRDSVPWQAVFEHLISPIDSTIPDGDLFAAMAADPEDFERHLAERRDAA